MLNLFKLKLNKTKKINKNTMAFEKTKENFSKNFPPSTREWNNSIYVFNKNALNFIPVITQLAIKIIKSYFNLYNFKLEGKIRKTKLLRRFKRLSSHKIFVSNGEFKHTNNKVIITLYLFNRQRLNYKSKIVKRYLTVFQKHEKKLNERFKLIKSLSLNYLDKANKKKDILIKALDAKHNLNKKTIKFYEKLYSDYYLTNFYKKIAKKSLNKFLIYLYYKQLVYINKSKLNFTYLQTLKNNLEKLYNKNVEFNLVNLKYFYLNSDILSEAITLKIKKNRTSLLDFFNILTRKIKIRELDTFLMYIPAKKAFLFNINNLTFLENNASYFKDKNKDKGKIKKTTLNGKDQKNNEIITIAKTKKIFLNNINYKHVTGFRLQAKGRLTRRYTASKSLSRLKYKGNLINIDSSCKGIPSVLLRGNLRSNLQYTKLKSKTRIGSFGIKGWVSGN